MASTTTRNTHTNLQQTRKKTNHKTARSYIQHFKERVAAGIQDTLTFRLGQLS
jgi:hypothetical protein